MEKDVQAGEQIRISRSFKVPLDFLWRAWTEPEIIKQWWGPTGFTCPYSSIDLRPGGKYVNCMRPPEGKDVWSTGIYKTVEHHKRIVCTDSFADKDGNIVAATYYGMSPDFPLEMLVEIEFEGHNDSSSFTLTHSGLPGEFSEQTKDGWNQSFQKIEDVYRKHFSGKTSNVLGVNPYLNFRGNTEEAFTFYKSIFGGEFISLQRFRDVPFVGNVPPDANDKIMHISLKVGNNMLMGSDSIESMGQKFSAGNNFYLSLDTASREEAERVFGLLSEGGKIEMPLGDVPWGSYFGMCSDKFGIKWMISFDPEREK